MSLKPPTTLGQLAEMALYLRISCRSCGHWRQLRAKDLANEMGPGMPWGWLRFRCQCGARDIAVQYGSPSQLRKIRFLPLYRRDDVLAAIVGGLRAHIHYLDESKATAIAETVVRRLMAAGLHITDRDAGGP